VEGSLRADGALVCAYRSGRTRAEAILDALRTAGIAIRDIATEEPRLEDVFVELTRRKPAA
jgi:ABC-2 type transport system ATP-binding protein